MLDDAVARANAMEHQRDQWMERALKAEAALKSLQESKRPTTFDEELVARRIAELETGSVAASLRQEITGLYSRIAGLEVQARNVPGAAQNND